MQSHFIVYLRQQTLKQSLVIFFFVVFITLLLLGAILWKAGENNSATKVLNLLFIHTATITFTMGIALLCSKRWPKVAEFIGLAVLVPTLVIIYVSYLSDLIEMDIATRNMQTYFILLLFFTVTNYMSVDFPMHLIYREIFYWAWFGFVAIKRSELNGENNLFSALGFGIVSSLIFEALLYTNHRAKATLFMQIKLMALKEEQLRVLLDTVPDKVLITTQATESRVPISLYCNLQTKQFFGADLV